MNPQDLNHNAALQARMAQRQQVLAATAATLKAELFGLDTIIDRLMDGVRAWYLLPELVERPVIVCLWGLTGAGKSRGNGPVGELHYSDELMQKAMAIASHAGACPGRQSRRMACRRRARRPWASSQGEALNWHRSDRITRLSAMRRLLRTTHIVRLHTAALALSACMASPALAQAGAACKPQGSVDEVNACAVRDFQQADTDIQVLYGDVMRIQSAHERPALRREQTAWMRERDARCRRETAAQQSRPEWPRLFHECLTRESKARRAGLMRWMDTEPPAPMP